MTDTGLANERTGLAWQRTALSLAAGAAIVARFTFDRLGVVAVAVLAVSVLLCAWVFVESRWRYAQHTGERPRRRQRGGRAPLFLTIATCLIAVTEATALALR